MAIKSEVLIAAAALAGAAATAAAFYFAQKAPTPAPRKVHVLLVKLTLREGGLELFKKLWAPLADWCRDHEPNTLSYELMFSTEKPEEVLIHERYVDITDLTTIHHTSAAFKEVSVRKGSLPPPLPPPHFTPSHVARPSPSPHPVPSHVTHDPAVRPPHAGGVPRPDH
jgi:quinol monooxygenase YgiN